MAQVTPYNQADVQVGQAYEGPPPPMMQQPVGQYQGVQPQPMMVPMVMYSLQRFPSEVQCPSCKNLVTSRVQFEIGTMTMLVAYLLFFFGFWPCACLPFCFDYFKDAAHYCPLCNYRLGIKQMQLA